jgi:predicted thioredoxin/glutaredoxin
MKENENTKQLVTLNKNMESLIDSSDANLSVNGKNASINDTNGRYMRNKSLYGTA